VRCRRFAAEVFLHLEEDMNFMRTSVLALAALNTTLVVAQDRRTNLNDLTLDQLEEVYLSCERAATGGELSTAGIMQCSIIYEELKWRAFDGDFDKLLAWAQGQTQTCARARHLAA
jgi:hypothetical protein